MSIKFVDGSVTAPKGFVASGVHCGIRKNKNKRDLALIYCEKPCTAAAIYTTNLVKSAPILVTRANLENGFHFNTVLFAIPRTNCRLVQKRFIIQSLQVDGNEYTKNYLLHGDLLKGGTLNFEMGDKPNLQRGVRAEDYPYSFSKEKRR